MNISIDPLGAALAAVGAYTGAIIWLVRVQGVATAARDGVSRLEERLERVEAIATDIKTLTQAFRDAQEYNRERFDDLKREIGHAKNNAASAKEMAQRASNKAASNQ